MKDPTIIFYIYIYIQGVYIYIYIYIYRANIRLSRPAVRQHIYAV